MDCVVNDAEWEDVSMNHQNINNSNNPRRGNLSRGNPVGMQIPVQMPMQIQQNQQQSEPQAQAFVQDQSQAMAQAQGNTTIGIASPSISVPASGTGKRMHKLPSRPSGGSSGQGTASPMKTMELAPAVCRVKRKLPDKLIPEKVTSIFPESALYTQLLEFEYRLDVALARKKTDIMESLKNPLSTQKVLRIYIFNTCVNQTGTNLEKGNSEPPSWSLKIIGRILEDGKDSGSERLVQTSSTKYPKLSSFLKKITIYLDQNLYPNNHVILWESSRSIVLREGFELKRKEL
ncbi:hypothetical protein OROMI_003587 [Orobanche minor]